MAPRKLYIKNSDVAIYSLLYIPMEFTPPRKGKQQTRKSLSFSLYCTIRLSPSLPWRRVLHSKLQFTCRAALSVKTWSSRAVAFLRSVSSPCSQTADRCKNKAWIASKTGFNLSTERQWEALYIMPHEVRVLQEWGFVFRRGKGRWGTQVRTRLESASGEHMYGKVLRNAQA